MYKILFVCTGATCRSPMAHAMFSHKYRQYHLLNVRSNFCGLNVEYGSGINERSKEALHEYGITRVCGSPAQIDGRLLSEYNIIICMTEDQKEALQIMVADAFVSKIACMKDFCGYDIPDPYGGSREEYHNCLKLIETAIEKIIEVLLGNGIAKRKK